MTNAAKKNAAVYLRGLKSQLQRDRHQLIDLMVGCRDEGFNSDIADLQRAVDNLEAATHNIDDFLNSSTGKHWEGQ